jgi:hypothetical protein
MNQLFQPKKQNLFKSQTLNNALAYFKHLIQHKPLGQTPTLAYWLSDNVITQPKACQTALAKPQGALITVDDPWVPFFKQHLSFHRSRRNLFEEALLRSSLLATTSHRHVVPRLGFEAQHSDGLHGFYTPHHYQLDRLILKMSKHMSPDGELEGTLRFCYSYARIAMQKIRQYIGTTGRIELIEVMAALPWYPQPLFAPFWLTLAYSHQGEWLGHSFCNSLTMLPAEVTPLTHEAQPVIPRATRQSAVKAFLETQYWDECEHRLAQSHHMDEAHWQALYVPKRTEYQRLGVTPPSISTQGWVQYEAMAQRWDQERNRLLNAMQAITTQCNSWQVRLSIPWALY